MKNRLIPSIIISIFLTIFLFDITIGWTFKIEKPIKNIHLIIVLVILISALLLSVIYFLRNYCKRTPWIIEKIYNFCFINIGKFKINQKIFFILSLSISVALLIFSTSFNLSWIFIFKYSTKLNDLTVDMLLAVILLNVLLHIIAGIWLLLIFKKSNNFYVDSRFALILIPFFGWIYFFTYQPARNYLLN